MDQLRMCAASNGTFMDKFCRNGKVHSVHLRISADKYGILLLFLFVHVITSGNNLYGVILHVL